MISKELLRAVVGVNILADDVFIKNNNIYYAYCRSDNEWVNSVMNNYELSHKCKEWAIRQSNKENKIKYCEITQIYTIFYKSKNTVSCYVHFYYEDGKDGAGKEFIAETEPEAIFKACEWILKEINATNK